MITPFYKRYSLLLLSLLLFITTACQTQEPSKTDAEGSAQTLPSDSFGQKVDAFLLKKMSEEYLPGVAVIVVKDGNVIYKKGYGVANIETGKKVDP